MNYRTDMRSARQVELDNYLRTIIELSRERPEILYRVIDLAREQKARGEEK
ncbi:MAG: hypothetical protein J4400_03785 [Candidatus Aenigmarchaeota archaeon]|nr:hypothetical protein [Candidatus Aenigmarchaeota archaeon]